MEITFKAETSSGSVDLIVFTTRPDTFFGVTYLVLAPEHPSLQSLTRSEQRSGVEAYVVHANEKSELERTDLQKAKTGVFTGHYLFNFEKI